MNTHIAHAPGHSALLRCGRGLVGLAFYTWVQQQQQMNAKFIHYCMKDVLPNRGKNQLTEIHDVVPTDCTVIHHNVPGPQCYSIPLEVMNKKSQHASGPQNQHPNNTLWSLLWSSLTTFLDSVAACNVDVTLRTHETVRVKNFEKTN